MSKIYYIATEDKLKGVRLGKSGNKHILLFGDSPETNKNLHSLLCMWYSPVRDAHTSTSIRLPYVGSDLMTLPMYVYQLNFRSLTESKALLPVIKKRYFSSTMINMAELSPDEYFIDAGSFFLNGRFDNQNGTSTSTERMLNWI
jgi:hypothetical protein